MPTYEYRCAQGHAFERFQRMTEAAIDTCPECGAPAERLMSAGGGLLFKGSGFYITDYRSDSYKKAEAADSGKSDPAKADSSKPDSSKPDSSKSESSKSDASKSAAKKDGGKGDSGSAPPASGGPSSSSTD